jgi:hypothetical protein
MARTSIALSVATLLFIAVGCGSSTPAAPSPTLPATTLHAEVIDPAGDSPSDPRVAASSDLVHATADVTDGNITFVVQFVPGTLDRQMTRVVILLDTDQSATTGIRQNDGMGADYALELVSSQATISKANPVTCAASQGCYDVVRSEQVTSIQDGMQMTMSLANLGNASGRMTFKLHTYVTIVVGQTVTPILFDSMPDDLLPPGRVQ